jgi:prepilin-type N-terminal cleavage/methylation domain-containing protein/prepilin-type processing-associated H-X9-DG protein
MMLQSLRKGFTLVELLVVISIIGMMMALLLPAVMQSREAARRAQCSNNLRNVGLALQGAVSARRRLPAAGNFSTTGTTYHGWVVELLPWLERSDVARQWNLDLPVTDPKNAALGSIQLSVLLCPDDDSLVSGRGNLSYVVNGGFGWTKPNDCPVAVHSGGTGMQTLPFDLSGNGVTCPANAQQDGGPSDRSLYFQTGLFFPENWPVGSGTVRHHSFDTVDDGLSRTIMLAENLHAGAVSGWSSPHPWGNSFYLSGYVCKNAKCSPGSVEWWRANDHSQLPYNREAINGDRTGAGVSPWPSSWHPDGVNAIYCDGHLSFLSQDIDGAVYASLVTPQGSRVQGPLLQPPMSDLSP